GAFRGANRVLLARHVGAGGGRGPGPPARPPPLRSAQCLERWTTCSSVNPYRPHGPFSTPTPLHLNPPKGWWGASARWVFTQAVPHSSRPAISAARSASALHTEPDSPKWVPLARARASSTSVYLTTGRAGPNCSSSTIRAPSSTSARIVGSKKYPGPSTGLPPAAARAPPASASATSSPTRSNCGLLLIGPNCTPSCMPSPTLAAFARAARASTTSP